MSLNLHVHSADYHFHGSGYTSKTRMSIKEKIVWELRNCSPFLWASVSIMWMTTYIDKFILLKHAFTHPRKNRIGLWELFYMSRILHMHNNFMEIQMTVSIDLVIEHTFVHAKLRIFFLCLWSPICIIHNADEHFHKHGYSTKTCTNSCNKAYYLQKNMPLIFHIRNPNDHFHRHGHTPKTCIHSYNKAFYQNMKFMIYMQDVSLQIKEKTKENDSFYA